MYLQQCYSGHTDYEFLIIHSYIARCDDVALGEHNKYVTTMLDYLHIHYYGST